MISSSKEYGPEKCRTLKFILADGDHWVFGILKNPASAEEAGQGTQRECFYVFLDNDGLGRIADVLKLLSVWVCPKFWTSGHALTGTRWWSQEPFSSAFSSRIPVRTKDEPSTNH